MSRTIEAQLSWTEARERILTLATPGEPIEVSLGESLGLTLAESVVADVDLPPFDRANRAGYSILAEEAPAGSFLRVVQSGRAGPASDLMIDSGEAGLIRVGDPLPPGTDAIIRASSVQPDPETGPVRVIEVRQPVESGQGVIRRGAYLKAGTTVVAAGTRIDSGLVPLLASQGCVHPLCHRRVRVSIVAVGTHWVGPAESPTMNRERNATNAALAARVLRLDAMPHDFQAVAGSQIRTALERATTCQVVVVVGEPSTLLTRAWKAIGYEPVVERVNATPVGRTRAGVIRDEAGRIVNHVVQLPGDPVAASIGFVLFVQPLIARLQGVPALETDCGVAGLAEDQTYAATCNHARVVAASSRINEDGRIVATLQRGPRSDLQAWSQATSLVIFPAHSGPWQGGDPVDFLPLD